MDINRIMKTEREMIRIEREIRYPELINPLDILDLVPSFDEDELRK